MIIFPNRILKNSLSVCGITDIIIKHSEDTDHIYHVDHTEIYIHTISIPQHQVQFLTHSNNSINSY